ncbi:hypothetical protein HPB48_022010 [Haemaphysalis longicornis]|uniref:Uncharacterized protein n=1 Tax=Haemaphysalis longicornis TaxID=44386 RepID=A0A9J6FVJ2_HAELO|nr:hypothetical protein HPB48_022010 [Haemaphysalis longicornis]
MAEHEKELGQHPGGYALLANGKVNRGKRAVYRWHEEWRNEKYGVHKNPLSKLHVQMSQYAANGTVICTATRDDSRAVPVAMPIMQRAQCLKSAQDAML